jgi:murein DD-endopeptidase MepM/ murein hydrolase activator NlpD
MFRKRTVATLAVVAAALLLQYLPKTSEAFAEEVWRIPIDKPVLMRDFTQPSTDWSAGHRGVDYLVTDGDAVFAPSSGTIRFSGNLVNRSVISIIHENGLISTLEPVCGSIVKGERVLSGQQIGSVCASQGYFSHCALNLCLHFGIKSESGYLSPLYKLGELSPSRLKPWDGQLRNFV